MKRNGKVQCLECYKVMESKYGHDYVSCGCKNGTFVDGGSEYARYGGMSMSKVLLLAAPGDEEEIPPRIKPDAQSDG